MLRHYVYKYLLFGVCINSGSYRKVPRRQQCSFKVTLRFYIQCVPTGCDLICYFSKYSRPLPCDYPGNMATLLLLPLFCKPNKLKYKQFPYFITSFIQPPCCCNQIFMAQQWYGVRVGVYHQSELAGPHQSDMNKGN